MEKVKLGIFDVFSFILPGLVIALSCRILLIEQIPGETEVDIISKIANDTRDMSITQVFLLLLVSYYIGIFMQYLSFKLFESIGRKIWKKRLTTNMKISDFETEIAVMRHKSPNNYIALEKWLALRGMSYNSFLAFLILFISLVYKLFTLWNTVGRSIILILIMNFVLIILSLRRAVTFHEWAVSTIRETSNFLRNDL